MSLTSEERSLHAQIRKRLEQRKRHSDRNRVTVNAGGTCFETTTATLATQPESQLAQLCLHGEQTLFLDVCPKAFEVLLCFLRSGAREIPVGSSVCAKSIGSAAQDLGLNICVGSRCRPGFCKIVWVDERRAKPKPLNCRELGLKSHRSTRF